MRCWGIAAGGLAAIGQMFLACSTNDRTSVDGGSPVDGSVDSFAEARADAGFVDGAMDDGATCEASLDDPRNCGRCGHDCIGGACEAGACQPWIVASDHAVDLASDGIFVYWLTGAGASGSVMRCPRLGCGGGVPLVVDAPAPTNIAVDSANVYYTAGVPDAGGYLAGCAKGGCDGGATILSSGHSSPSWLVVDSNAVFFDVDRASLFTCALPSCGNGSGLATTTPSARGLAQEWNLLYWTEGASSIWGCVKSTCDSTRKSIATGLGPLRAVAAWGGTVFATQGGVSGRVLRCPNAPNCVPAEIAKNLVDPTDIEADWTGLYFIEQGMDPSSTGRVDFCPQGGCVGTPRVLVDNLSFANAVALDLDAVYVASAGSPIWGIAKP